MSNPLKTALLGTGAAIGALLLGVVALIAATWRVWVVVIGVIIALKIVG